MRTLSNQKRGRAVHRGVTSVVALTLLGVSACNDILSVDLPTRVPDSALNDPAMSPVLVQGAPFLSATTTPRLDRKRTTRVKVSCDQDCSLVVRLSGTLRTRKSLAGPQVRRSIRAKRVVALTLRLPSKPRGTLKTVWVTGRVRNAAGDVRSVKLPVRLPR